MLMCNIQRLNSLSVVFYNVYLVTRNGRPAIMCMACIMQAAIYTEKKTTGHGDSFIRVISLPPFWLWDKSQITRIDKSKFTRLLFLKWIVDELI